MTPKLGHQKHYRFHSALFWITLEEASFPQTCCEDTEPTLWRGRRGEEMKPPANNQHQLASHVSETPWKYILNPQSSCQMAIAPVDVLTTIS